MTLKALRTIRVANETYVPGQMFQVDDERAHQLIALGTAIPYHYETKVITPEAAPLVAASTFRHRNHADDGKAPGVVAESDSELPPADPPVQAPPDRKRGRGRARKH